MSTERAGRTRRRWWKVALVAGVLLLPVLLAALLPSWLNSSSGRAWLLGRANQALAPGRLEVGEFGFSWFGPTRMKAVTLVDRDQTRVIAAEHARSDRTLWQLLLTRPRLGTLVLERCSLDLERRADGTVNLYETLKPILRGDPRLDLRVVVDRGRLRFRNAGMAEPVVADRANVTLELAPSPRPLTWRVDLAQDGDAGRAGTLSLEGEYDRWGKGPKDALDVELHADASAWPLAVDQAGVSVRGRLHGKVSVERRERRWSSTADARLTALDVSGSRLGEDQLRLDELKAVWDVAGTAGAWDVRTLDVTSPLGALHAQGTPAGASRIEGTLDVAALARQLPHLFGLRDGLVVRTGAAELSVSGRNEPEGQAWDVRARLSDLHAKDEKENREFTLRSPATFSGRVARRGDALTLERMALASAFLNVEGQGELDRGVVLNGTFDLKALQSQLDGLMDFGRLRLSGRGGLSGRYRRTGDRYAGSLDTELHGLRIEGAGPTTVERDSARVTVTLEGNATKTGLPASWTALRAAVASGLVEAELTAAGDGAATVWNGSAHAPLRLGERTHEARAVFAARNDGASLALERVELSLRPEEGEPVVIRARGAFDRSDGTLTLLPLEPQAQSGPVRLARDGVRVRGLGSAQAFRADVGLDGDTAQVARLLAPDVNVRGTWSARATALSKDEGVQIAARLEARGLSDDVEGPVVLALDALVPPGSAGIELSELTLSSAYATVESSGRLSDEAGRRTVELRGTVTPGWDALNRLSVRRIDPHASLAGKPGKLAFKADVSDLSFDAVRRTVEGELGFELTSANLFGMRVGRAQVGLRAANGTVRVEPIDTTINEGRLHLEPTLVLEGEGAPALRLGPESSVRDAAINDEVSHRVLSFVAPVLESATRVRGRVSVALEDAEFPIGGDRDRHAEVDGTVTFHDVEFVAGALVDDLMAMIGREPRMGVKLNKPVALVIADGRVRTEGLALPLGNVSEIAFDGWVDFDRHLRMTASLPVTRKMVLDVGFLGDIVEGTRISVPIGGTLDHPQIDREALKLGFKDLGKTLLERTAGRGAADLLMRLVRPRDPDAPGRLTPEQRRERRMERRMRREGLVPPGG